MDGKEPERRTKQRTASVTTDLGVIQVQTRGDVDVVMLTHNQKIIFRIHCPPGKASVVAIAKDFFEYSHDQWQEVFRVYERWKRQSLPKFTMTRHSGRTKDGHEHPWRTRSVPTSAGLASKIKKAKRKDEESEEDLT